MNQDQWIKKALSLLNQGKLGPARAICNKILSHHSDHHQANALMGAIHISLDEPANALPYLNRADATARNDQERAQALNNLGLAYTHLNDYPAALKALDSAINCVQDNALFYCNRANVFERIGNWPSMAQDCEYALKWVPNLTDARVALAVALRHQAKTDEALRTLELKPSFDDTDWLNEWTLLNLISDKTDQALQLAEELSSDSAVLDIADYIAEEGFERLAQPIYRWVLERTPDHPRAKHLNDALLGQQVDRVPAEYVQKLYNHHAGEFETRLQETLGYDLPSRFAALWQTSVKQPITRWLDAGCGTGLVGQALKPAYPDAYFVGIDLAESMLKHAKKKACYDELHLTDLLEYQSEIPFDLITAMDVMIYLGKLAPVLDHWKSLLTSKGRIAFSIETNNEADQAEVLQKNGRFAHHSANVKAALTDHGFALISTEAFVLRKESGEDVLGELFIAQLKD
jgi:predicted TPR repeat methyltransferase/Tfp pilus assembly protein PilF